MGSPGARGPLSGIVSMVFPHSSSPGSIPGHNTTTTPEQRIAEISRCKGETQQILRTIGSAIEEVLPNSAVLICHVNSSHEALIHDFRSQSLRHASRLHENGLDKQSSPHAFCIARGEDLFLPNLATHPVSQTTQTWIQEAQVHAAIIRRIRPSNGDCWGCLAVYFREHYASESDLKQQDMWVQLAATIIERRLLEDALRTSEIRFELAAKASGIGIFDFNVITGELFWTTQTKQIFGVSPALEKFTYDDWRRKTHPEDAATIERQLEEATKNRERSFQSQSRFFQQDGEVHWLKTFGEIIYDPAGNAIRIIGTTQEITDIINAEEQMENERRRLELALEAGELGFWDWHIPSGSVQFGGQWASMLGYALNEIEPHIHAWESMVHPDDMPSVLEVLSKHLQGLSPFYESEHRLQAKDGSWVWVLDRGRVIERDADNSPVRAIGVNSNITQKRAVQETLREADKRKDEFLATLAHELRNPLAPIRTGLAIIKKDPLAPQAIKAREMMERQLCHMVRLVDDLLDVSRITTGRLILKKELISAQSVIDLAIEASKPYIDMANHTLSVVGLHDEVKLYCDSTRVAQTISNILNNAAKYTPDGGHIVLQARATGNTLEIAITDNGLGIPGDMLEHVFDLFGQVNRTLDRAQGGLGIGLALVKTLAQLHGGDVYVGSPGVNKGSTFTIRLPLEKSEETISQDNIRELPRHCMSEKRVLIVDDNIDGAESLSMFTSLLGHKAEVAHSGSEALEKMQTFRPDVIFLDIGLPGMSGFEVAKLIRRSPQALNTHLVALTGWGSEETKRQAEAVGFNSHLTKPVELSEIEAILNR